MLPTLHTPRRTIAALTLLAASIGAFAADAPRASPCRDDAKTLCATVQPGGGRAIACLKQHESELSAACRAALPTIERCAQEAHALCSGSGRREMRSCLRDNADKLSAECRHAAPQR